jgi:hypothetical protein
VHDDGQSDEDLGGVLGVTGRGPDRFAPLVAGPFAKWSQNHGRPWRGVTNNLARRFMFERGGDAESVADEAVAICLRRLLGVASYRYRLASRT